MAHQLAAGQKLGHLTVVRLLGSGGMADVYEAVDGRLGRHVAMKVLPREYSRNQDFIMRFEREVKASAALSHPNIVTVFEFGSEDDLNYYTMRLLNGGDLRDRITKGMTLIEVLMTMRGVLQAFQHAHARGFVHRDVKPENIMFDEMGTPTLTDFGIAKVLDSQTQMTQTGMAVGTPRYISPEQATGKPVDGRSDLYSLGCILYEMLTGSSPYKAETPIATIFQHVNEPIPRLDDEFGAFQPLLDRLMAKSPETRMQNAEEAMEFIDQAFPRDWTGAFGAHTTQGMPAVGAPTPSVTPIRTQTVPATAPPAGDEAATQLMSTSPGVVDDSGEGKTQFMPAARSADPASASGEGERTMFLPHSGAGAAKAAPSRARETHSAEGKSKRILLIAAVLLLVLAAGGYVVFTGLLQQAPTDTADEPVLPRDEGVDPTIKEDTRTDETGDAAAEEARQEQLRKQREDAEREADAAAEAEADRRAREEAAAKAEAERKARADAAAEAERRAQEAEQQRRIEEQRRAQERPAQPTPRPTPSAAERRAKEEAERRAREERRRKADAEAQRLQNEEAERQRVQQQRLAEEAEAARKAEEAKKADDERKERLKKPVPIGF